MKNNKIFKNTLSFILIFTILLSNLSLSFSKSNTIYINSLEDLIEFSENASLDTYYNNKTLVLNTNISLLDIDYFSIPTFNGVFDGQGYTISDFSISTSGSVQGLFRYLQEDGQVKNLNVSGNVTPSGSQNIVGGIVASNRGSIENCSFIGDVEGKNNIGGIVGINEATGTITNSQAEGTISGEHFTGGIAGQNLGTILKSTNFSKVNTSLEDTSLNLDDIDWTQINAIENVNAHTDTGGIAGLSTGYIQDSVNRGPIGYKHMGYNVGGIVGRQSGYLSNCENYNTVLGRKDVGGIVGQIEPYLILLFSEDTLQKLNKEIEVLENILSSSFNNFKSYSLSDEIDDIILSVDDTKDSMQVLSRGTLDHIDDITDTVNITNERIRYTLEEISPILEETKDFSTTFNSGLDHIEVAFDKLESSSGNLSHALSEGDYAVDDLRYALESGEDAIYNLRRAIRNLSDNIGSGNLNKKDFRDLENKLGDLEGVLKTSLDKNTLKDLERELEDTLKEDLMELDKKNSAEKIKDLKELEEELNSELDLELNKAMDKLRSNDSLNHSPDNSLKRLSGNSELDNLIEELESTLEKDLEELNKEDALDLLEDKLEKLKQLIKIDYELGKELEALKKEELLEKLEEKLEKLKELIDLEEILEGFKDLSDPLISIADTISALKRILGNLDGLGGDLIDISDDLGRDLNYVFDDLYESSRKLDRATRGLSNTFSKLEKASDESGAAFGEFSRGFDEFSKASEAMTGLVGSIKDLVDSLVDKPDIEIPNISSDYRQSGEKLFDNMGNITSNISRMNKKMGEGKTSLANDFKDINDQVLNIFELLVESREEIGSSGYIEDISDENIDENSLGTVYKNRNYGSIDADINVGGIVGAMSIEYDIDPEDDIFKQGTPSLNFKYLTSAILKNCINHGRVTSKKDYVGGVAGLMDLGVISNCENYGEIESREGSYVGGIAGASYTKINRSFSLSSISGEDYLGGIAGYGNDISNSYALIEVQDGSEWIGSIAGRVDGNISANYYVHESVAAIDGIDYSGKASSLSYDELLKVETLPRAFSELYLTFIADGEIIERVAFKYGDSFDLDLLPPIPKKDDHDSYWEEFDSDNMTFNTTVEAVYSPFLTVLSSNISRNKDDLPLLLAEGQFHQGVSLNLYPFDMDSVDSPFDSGQVLEAWNIELDDFDEKDKISNLRLLLAEEEKNITVWEYKDESWEKLPSSVNGSYVVFDMYENSGVFAIVEKGISSALILVVAILGLGIIFFLNRKLSKKRN